MKSGAADQAAAAREVKELLTRCSPLIEKYTQRVCPSCTEVCCRQKHGMPTCRDRTYFRLLGEAIPQHDPAHAPDAICRFLGPRGCAKPRWQRAWKCTWFFCDSLLEALNAGPQKEARELTTLFEAIMQRYAILDGKEEEER